VDTTTPVIWDFDEVTKMTVIPMDANPLIIKGGVFTTWPSQKVSTIYHNRGIRIERSNVIVDQMKHFIKKTGKNGPPYGGFISMTKCANVTVRDTTFTGRVTYHKIGSAGYKVPMGSYAISINSAINIKFKNCSQSNSIHDRKFWGIMGTNFCKNLELDGCEFSRFDAHQGVTNATVMNSEIGYMGILAIGHGNLIVENSKVHSQNFISFRPDYGSTWRGNVSVKNCTFIPRNNRESNLFAGRNTGDHDFGYTCFLPEKVYLENIRIENKGSKENIAIFGEFNPNYGKQDKIQYPIVVSQEVHLKNITSENGKDILLSRNPSMFKKVNFSKKD